MKTKSSPSVASIYHQLEGLDDTKNAYILSQKLLIQISI